MPERQVPPPLPPFGGPSVPPDGNLELAGRRYADAVEKAFAEHDPGGVGTSVLAGAILVVLALTVVLLPLAIFGLYRWVSQRPQKQVVARGLTVAREFVRAARPVLAYPLMVNSMLRSEGTRAAPGLVLISFDPALAGDDDRMTELAVTVSHGVRLDGPPLSDRDAAFCDVLMADEQYHPFRRRAIPSSLTGGPVAYACDLPIHPLLLPGRRLSDASLNIPCVAEPGDAGRIMQMPHWFVRGEGPPGPEEDAEFALTLLTIEGLMAAAAAQRRD